MTLLRVALPLCAALTVLGTTATARAEGEACARDTDCGGPELCLQQVCAVPETLPVTCEGECESPFQYACIDGYCKSEGVACDNPAGRCWVEQDHGECECLSGEGAGWSDGFNPDDPPEDQTDEELFTECTAVLAETCGTEPPTLPDSCQGEVLATCQTLVDTEFAALVDCGDTPPGATIAAVGHCCDSYDQPEAQTYRDCILAGADAPTCALLDDCAGASIGQGEGANDGDTDGGPTGTAEDDTDEAKSACSVGGGTPGALLLLGLLGLRRRRLRA